MTNLLRANDYTYDLSQQQPRRHSVQSQISQSLFPTAAIIAAFAPVVITSFAVARRLLD